MTLNDTQSTAHSVFERPSTDSGTLFTKAQGLLSLALRRLHEETEARQAIWELQQLDDHDLRDIGLLRCDIEAHVRGLRKQATNRSRRCFVIETMRHHIACYRP